MILYPIHFNAFARLSGRAEQFRKVSSLETIYSTAIMINVPGAPAGRVELYDNGRLVDVSFERVGTHYSASFDLDSLSHLPAEGEHILRVRVVGPQGESYWSDALAFTAQSAFRADFDPAVLSADGVALLPGSTVRNEVVILSGYTEAGAQVVLQDNGATLGRTVADGDGHWQYTTPILGQGRHVFGLIAMDARGNMATQTGAAPVLTVDTQVSIATIDLGVGVHRDKFATVFEDWVYTSDVRPTLTGLVEAGSTLELFDGFSKVAVLRASDLLAKSDGSAAWSVTLPTLAVGLHAFAARVTDALGNMTRTNTVVVAVTPYVGNAKADSLSGSRGADILIGAGGADTIRAGAGDDLILVSDQAFRLIDGGAGRDTLRVKTDLFLLDEMRAGTLSGMETIDVRASGHTDLMVFPAAVNALGRTAQGGPALLDILLDAEDDIYLYKSSFFDPYGPGLPWEDLGTTVDGSGQAWHLYGHASLAAPAGIQPVLRVGIPPGMDRAPVHLE